MRQFRFQLNIVVYKDYVDILTNGPIDVVAVSF